MKQKRKGGGYVWRKARPQPVVSPSVEQEESAPAKGVAKSDAGGSSKEPKKNDRAKK